MADLTDPKILEAYTDVRSKSDTDWLILDYEACSDRSNSLNLSQTGTGGLGALAEALDNTKCQFAYARVSFSNDKESTREKFIFVAWIGKECRQVLRKAKMSVHGASVKEVLRAYAIEVAAVDRDDLKEGPIVHRLRKAGGASYDGV
ncbi:ADF-like domain-containing protein [Fistulina hepatica ATCC 64428]|uniref:ADF-like domain-containing protein n=1 Tax=Fistulina hepatica ATCC 64428 TaxID=1128425 RepID=A0A0D7A8T8_9AGAR|nr:ADF-like domain-containing protein [Fistulina hepatica ATCC 64428]